MFMFIYLHASKYVLKEINTRFLSIFRRINIEMSKSILNDYIIIIIIIINLLKGILDVFTITSDFRSIICKIIQEFK